MIHCAGIVSVASKPPKNMFDVNIKGTENVIKMCLFHRVGKPIYISSVHAIPRTNVGAFERGGCDYSYFNMAGGYAKSKAEATQKVLSAVREGLNANVVFPSGIMGPGDISKGSMTNLIYSFVFRNLSVAVKGGYEFVDVRDVASGIIACAKRGGQGSCYVFSGNYATIREILEIIQETVGQKRRILYLPYYVAKFIARLYEPVCRIMKKPLLFTPYSVEVLSHGGRFSSEKARSELGYETRHLACTIRDMVFWTSRETFCEQINKSTKNEINVTEKVKGNPAAAVNKRIDAETEDVCLQNIIMNYKRGYRMRQ